MKSLLTLMLLVSSSAFAQSASGVYVKSGECAAQDGSNTIISVFIDPELKDAHAQLLVQTPGQPDVIVRDAVIGSENESTVITFKILNVDGVITVSDIMNADGTSSGDFSQNGQSVSELVCKGTEYPSQETSEDEEELR